MTGKRTPRITDVAARAGVSPALVSRLLNGDPSLRIKEEKRRRILDSVEELNYVPHSSARALRRARSGAFGLFLHDLSSPIYYDVIRGAQAAASAADCVLLFGDTDRLDAGGKVLSSTLASRRIDGLLVQGGYSTAADAQILELAERLPTVVINAKADGAMSSVRLADEAAAALAARHLVELGHARIGMVAGPRDSETSQRRENGLRDALQDAGISVAKNHLVRSSWNADDGVAAMTRLLEARPRPTAVVVANLVVAVGALTAARRAGVRIPEELSVVAIHDAWFAEHQAPPLTTVRLPLAELGRRAIEVLIEQVDGAEPRDVFIPTEPRLVARESTAPSRDS